MVLYFYFLLKKLMVKLVNAIGFRILAIRGFIMIYQKKAKGVNVL